MSAVPHDLVMSDGMAEPPRDDPYAWHVGEAEKLLRIAAQLGMPPNTQDDLALERTYIAVAQVHAGLAQAAATHEVAREVRELRSQTPEGV